MDWQPIETAPQDGTYILIFTPGEGAAIAECSEEYGAWWLATEFPEGGWQPRREPTHWQPLPAPPSRS